MTLAPPTLSESQPPAQRMSAPTKGRAGTAIHGLRIATRLPAERQKAGSSGGHCVMVRPGRRGGAGSASGLPEAGPSGLLAGMAYSPMTARSRHEDHRAATPLELFFDLCFVVAVAQCGARLVHSLAEGHPGTGVIGYFFVFFGVWWAWRNGATG